MKLKHVIPILSWLPSYKKEWLRADISAGLTVGIMLIPQGMAYAMIAGLPPIHGLYAAMIPILVYAIFGTSRQLAVGPVAMDSLLVAAGVSQFAEMGTENYLQLAILLALMVGSIQFIFGIAKLGFIVNFLSKPVISGFTSAAALIIGLSQLQHLLGIDIPRSNFIYDIIAFALNNLHLISYETLFIGTLGIILIILVKRIHRAIPGPLIAVVFGILIVWLGGVNEQQVNIVGTVPSGLPTFAAPTISSEQIVSLIPVAITIALVGFMESIAVSKAVQARHKDYDLVPNQELIGIGLANVGGAFFQGFPITGGFSRTAVNDQAGAKTGLASIISAVLLALTLLFLTSLFYYLPKAILASVIMVAVFRLINYKVAVNLWKSKRDDFYMLLATFLGTLTLGIEEGILIGVALSLGMVIYRSSYPHIAVLGRVPGSIQYRNISRFDDVEERKDVLIIRLDAQLYFANISYFLDFIDHKVEEKGKDLQLVVLDFAAINDIDASAIEALEEHWRLYRSNNIYLYFAGVKGPVRDTMTKSGFLDNIGKEHFFTHIEDSISYFDLKDEGWVPKDRERATQTNYTSG